MLSSGRSGRLAARNRGLCPHLSEGLSVEVLSAQFFSAPLFEQQEKWHKFYTREFWKLLHVKRSWFWIYHVKYCVLIFPISDIKLGAWYIYWWMSVGCWHFVGFCQTSTDLLVYCGECNLNVLELVREWYELVCLCVYKMQSTNLLLRSDCHLKLKLPFLKNKLFFLDVNEVYLYSMLFLREG